MEDQRVMAILAHVLGLFTSFMGPLVMYLVADNSKPFMKDHAREALNFQITVLLANFISGVLTIIVIGFLGLIAVYFINLIFCILAAVAASNNQEYRYPMNIRFINA